MVELSLHYFTKVRFIKGGKVHRGIYEPYIERYSSRCSIATWYHAYLVDPSEEVTCKDCIKL